MPSVIATILDNRLTGVFARILLCLPFWLSGLVKLFDFSGGVAEMEMFGLTPGWAFNTATIVTQLGASALIILNRWTWLGAGACAVFTVLTIFLVHSFWRIEGPMQIVALHTAMEHLGMIGGFMLVAILSRRPLRS